MALVDELRRLSVVLPPSFRISSGEVQDVLGALATYAEHGQGILDAAAQGPQAVADFYHDHIVATRPEGAEEPTKGAPVSNVPPTGPAAPTGVTQAQFAELTALVGQLAQAIQGSGGATPAQPAPDQAPATADTPPAPEATVGSAAFGFGEGE